MVWPVRPGRALLWAAGLCASVAAVLSGVAASSLGVPEGRAQEAEKYEKVRHLYYVLSLYEMRTGSLPYSPRGPEYALYELKDCLRLVPQEPQMEFASGYPPMDATVLDVPYTELKNGPAVWDNASKRALSVDYDYINERKKLDKTAPAFAIYAEKAGSSKGGRWVVFSNGATLWLSERNALFADVLGRSRDQLSTAEPGPVEAPIGTPNSWMFWDAESPMHGIQLALREYAEQHGSTPWSDKGGDYALYAIRAWAPGWFQNAWTFDAMYTRLKNGVAYWDDDEKCVRNAGFVYLNKPIEPKEFLSKDPMVIFAGRPGVPGGGHRWCIGANLFAFWVKEGTKNAEDPLGRRQSELDVSWP